MPRFFDYARDLQADSELLRRRRYGVIEMAAGQLVGIQLRPWPKVVSIWETMLRGERFHRQNSGDRCWLYYNQPRHYPGFLALTYVLSTRQCRLATFKGALDVLDEIARLKGTDALLCDAANSRISDRLLSRWGWQSHCPSRWHRNFIKRFYGEYPTAARDVGAVALEAASIC